MDIQWTSHLQDQQAKDDFEKVLRNNTLIFDRMHAILNQWEADINKKDRGQEQYKQAGWMPAMAHRFGNKETIQRMRDLISFYKQGVS